LPTRSSTSTVRAVVEAAGGTVEVDVAEERLR
jgi:hypothetical protein